jgi:DNA mismatch endonuclease (patch repair protein)
MPAPPADPSPAERLDRLTPEERSRNMARIRSHNTKPEKIVRQLVTALGLRYRLQRRDLPGKPDLVFGPRRTDIFVHGCFWHQHAHCPAGRIPTGNRPFWETKLARNTQRDAATKLALQRLGWRVLTVWECETKTPGKLQKRLARLLPPLAPE